MEFYNKSKDVLNFTEWSDKDSHHLEIQKDFMLSRLKWKISKSFRNQFNYLIFAIRILQLVLDLIVHNTILDLLGDNCKVMDLFLISGGNKLRLFFTQLTFCYEFMRIYPYVKNLPNETHFL